MDTEIRVSTESRRWRSKLSRLSCRDSNPRPFNHESGALTTELFSPPERRTAVEVGEGAREVPVAPVSVHGTVVVHEVKVTVKVKGGESHVVVIGQTDTWEE